MQKDLMRALNFTADDLAANRSGALSERQQMALPRRNWQPALRSIGAALAALVVITLTLISSQSSSEVSDVRTQLMPVLFIGVGLIVLLYFLWQAYQQRPDPITDLSVKSATGHAVLNSGINQHGNPIYRVRIDDSSSVLAAPIFVINQQAYPLFRQGVTYRVYYLRDAGLLSVEVVEPALEKQMA